MLDKILCIIQVALILFVTISKVKMRKYIKLHENELVEDNEKQLMHRVNSITITIILILVLGLIRTFIK